MAPSKASPGKSEIIDGQRRALAHQHLGLTNILAAVFNASVSHTEAKAISLTKSKTRFDLTLQDLIDVCTALYERFGSVRLVSEETGLPLDKVKESVEYDRL